MTAFAYGAAALTFALALGVEGQDPSPPEQAPPPPARRYAWPVQGPVLRRFEPPAGPFGAGHRGIDIGAAVGTPVRSAEDGTVAFAGVLAGERFVSVDHEGGIRTTYSWLAAIAVKRGDRVTRGSVLGASGHGHAGSARSHLHLGARLHGIYVDPLLLLEPRSVAGLIRLAPLRDG